MYIHFYVVLTKNRNVTDLRTTWFHAPRLYISAFKGRLLQMTTTSPPSGSYWRKPFNPLTEDRYIADAVHFSSTISHIFVRNGEAIFFRIVKYELLSLFFPVPCRRRWMEMRSVIGSSRSADALMVQTLFPTQKSWPCDTQLRSLQRADNDTELIYLGTLYVE